MDATPAHRIGGAGCDGDTAALVALKDGVFDVTMTQQTQKMGRMGVDSAIALVAGEKLPADQLLPATLTTKDNVEGFIAKHP
jgi:ribose transport system substrate-binding protein